MHSSSTMILTEVCILCQSIGVFVLKIISVFTVRKLRKQGDTLSTRQQKHTQGSIDDPVYKIRTCFPMRGAEGIRKTPLSPVTTASVVQGSWPLIIYVSGGTPIDRNRIIEWGGNNSEEATEDRMFFLTIHSISLDSALRVSRAPISPRALPV
jgi:hypothetical protein